jgi:hypothetical protein
MTDEINENQEIEESEKVESQEKTEEKTEEKIDYAPMSVVDELREDRRQLRNQVAELQKRIEEKPKEEVKAGEKSPMELFAEEYGEGIAPDAKTMIEQRKWDMAQAEKTAKKKAAEDNQNKVLQYENEAKETYSTENAGAGLELTTILRMGESLLSEGDRIDIFNEINKGKNPYDLAYKRCIHRINEAGGDNAKKLAARIEAHKKLTKKEEKPEIKKGGNPPEEQEEEYTGERIYKPVVDYIFSD